MHQLPRGRRVFVEPRRVRLHPTRPHLDHALHLLVLPDDHSVLDQRPFVHRDNHVRGCQVVSKEQKFVQIQQGVLLEQWGRAQGQFAKWLHL